MNSRRILPFRPVKGRTSENTLLRTRVNSVGCQQRWETYRSRTREANERRNVRGTGDRRQGDESLGHSRCAAVALRVPPGYGLALAQIPLFTRPHGVGSGVGPLRPSEVAQRMATAIRYARARAKRQGNQKGRSFRTGRRGVGGGGH